MSTGRLLRGQSDCFVGRRRRIERYLICSMQGYFPVLVKTGPAALAVIYRTGGTHIAASATLAVATSADGGRSWSDPVEIRPRWEDSRNPAFGINAQGELIAVFWMACLNAYVDSANGPAWRGEGKTEDKTPSIFITSCPDNGKTWGAPRPYLSRLLKLASPYGRIISAPDGSLLMCLYGKPREPVAAVRDVSILVRSRDGGKTWGDETLVAAGYNETSFAFLPDGQILAAARSESGHVATLASADSGRTWTQPVQVTRCGELPADLTVLQSGKVLMTFGRRIRPMGCGALVSADNGRTWDTHREILLAGDGIRNGDLGYPSTVQLDDGTLVTALYYASGSETGMDGGGWGDISCQALHYREATLFES